MLKTKVLIAFTISIIIYIFLWNSFLIAPLRIYLTALHEACHGIATILTGGGIYKMSLNHFSGTLMSSGGFYPLISISGYLGSALIGALLISSKNKNLIFIAISIIVFLISLIYIDSYFSKEFVLLNVMLFILGFIIWKGLYIQETSLLIGSLLGIESLQDIRIYLIVAPERTDSGLLANYLGTSFLTFPISIFLFIISMYIWYRVGLKRVLNEKSL